MVTIAVPYHLDEHLPAFDPAVPVDQEVTAPLPAGGPWERMGALYERVADAVQAAAGPGAGTTSTRAVVVSGDCTTSLGVLAGLQRAGRAPGVVWFDAHADFHTAATTTSGYLGGMPLALAVGTGTLDLPTALGLHPVPEERAVLVDARDTDPGERELLEGSSVVRLGVGDLDAGALPEGDLYLHLDVDVLDPAEVPHLLYPAPRGVGRGDLLAAIGRVAATGRVVAVGVAATWDHDQGSAPAHRELLEQVLRALEPQSP